VLLLWLSAVAAVTFFLRWLLSLGKERRRREMIEARREAALRVRRRPVRYLPPHIHPANRHTERRLSEKPALLILLLGGGLVALVVVLVAVWTALSWLTGEPFLGRAEPQPAASQDEEAGADLPLAPAEEEEGAPPVIPGDTYAWADQEAGLAQIPVDRAFELLVERGYPTPEGGIGATPVVTETATPAPEAQSEEDMVSAGVALFQTKGCADCHRPDGQGIGPQLNGVFGSEERLQSGETVTVDEAYVRRSILEPRAQIVAGYHPVMPSFAEHLTEQELEQLIAYIRSIGSE
jgi:mono/diheme cytochrome c family protein